MNILSEVLGMHILEQNEQLKDVPYPKGAFSSIDDFRNYVNANQKPIPTEWRLPKSYQHYTTKSSQHLKTATLPETVCEVILVAVEGSGRSHVVSTFVPPFDKLVHDPSRFGHGKESDLERSLENPNQFLSLEQYTIGDDNEYKIEYHFADGVGLIPNLRNNSWLLFSNLEAAQAYSIWIQDNKPPESELALALEELFEALADEADHSYDDLTRQPGFYDDMEDNTDL